MQFCICVFKEAQHRQACPPEAASSSHPRSLVQQQQAACPCCKYFASAARLPRVFRVQAKLVSPGIDWRNWGVCKIHHLSIADSTEHLCVSSTLHQQYAAVLMRLKKSLDQKCSVQFGPLHNTGGVQVGAEGVCALQGLPVEDQPVRGSAAAAHPPVPESPGQG